MAVLPEAEIVAERAWEDRQPLHPGYAVYLGAMVAAGLLWLAWEALTLFWRHMEDSWLS